MYSHGNMCVILPWCNIVCVIFPAFGFSLGLYHANYCSKKSSFNSYSNARWKLVMLGQLSLNLLFLRSQTNPVPVQSPEEIFVYSHRKKIFLDSFIRTGGIT
jgi:hypothetical protein